jgi:hypothetical protein
MPTSYSVGTRSVFSYSELREEICIAGRIMFNSCHFNCHQQSMKTANGYDLWNCRQINSMKEAFTNFVRNIVNNIKVNVGDMLKIALQEHRVRHCYSVEGKCFLYT